MAVKCFSLYLILAAIVIGGVTSEYIEYNTKPRIVPEKINVHLVPHSHDDVGWLKTVDQYYVGSNNSIRGACVQNVLDSVIASLLDDENRKFIYVEMVRFRYYQIRSFLLSCLMKLVLFLGFLSKMVEATKQC
jgi:alpha-mannosidase